MPARVELTVDDARLVLARLDDDAGACNNGCQPCVTRPLPDPGDVAGRHVVVRQREATLRRGP